MGDYRKPLNHTSEVILADGGLVLTFFSSSEPPECVAIDRATAARLINQLRRALDDDYNRAINERPGGSDDYGSA